MRRLILLLSVLLLLLVAAPAGAQVLPPNASGDFTFTDAQGVQGVRCFGPVAIGTLTITEPVGGDSGNALSLGPGCTGSIERVEISTGVADGIKCLNPSAGVPQDLTINGGYVRSIGFTPGAHADGIQCMGGTNITFNDLLIDFRGAPGGGGFYPSLGGGEFRPVVDVVCDGCHVIHGAHSVQVDAATRSGVRNSVLCEPLGAGEHNIATYHHGDTVLVDPVGVSRFPVAIHDLSDPDLDALSDGNVAVPSSDARCVSEPGDEPDPPDPPPPYNPACAPTCDEQIAALRADVAAESARADRAEQLSLRYRTALMNVKAIVDQALEE